MTSLRQTTPHRIILNPTLIFYFQIPKITSQRHALGTCLSMHSATVITLINGTCHLACIEGRIFNTLGRSRKGDLQRNSFVEVSEESKYCLCYRSSAGQRSITFPLLASLENGFLSGSPVTLRLRDDHPLLDTTPLSYANRHEGVVRLFLARSDVDKNSKDYNSSDSHYYIY